MTLIPIPVVSSSNCHFRNISIDDQLQPGTHTIFPPEFRGVEVQCEVVRPGRFNVTFDRGPRGWGRGGVEITIVDWHVESVDGQPSFVNSVTDGNRNTRRRRWHKRGTLHREDGPAIKGSDGYEVWMMNGVRHRDEGPAVIAKSGGLLEWWNDGAFIKERVRGRPLRLADEASLRKHAVPADNLPRDDKPAPRVIIMGNIAQAATAYTVEPSEPVTGLRAIAREVAKADWCNPIPMTPELERAMTRRRGRGVGYDDPNGTSVGVINGIINDLIEKTKAGPFDGSQERLDLSGEIQMAVSAYLRARRMRSLPV